METKYYILKQFVPNTQIWVAKLDDNDPMYWYPTLEEAEAALVTLKPNYPDRALKVSTEI